MGDGLKWCPKCEQWKPYSEFSRDRATKDGYRGRCKTCDKATYERRRANPEKREADHARQKRWYEANKERHRAKCRRNMQLLLAHDPDRQRQYDRKWYRKRGLASNRSYREANRDRFRGYWALRRARKRGAQIETVDRAAIIARDDQTCYLCGRYLTDPDDITLDHVVPLSRGGAHAATNLRVACRECNFRKNRYLLGELAWLRLMP